MPRSGPAVGVSATGTAARAAVDVRSFMDAPGHALGGSWTSMHSVKPDQLAELQRAGVRLRFAELRDRIPVLATLSASLDIAEIEHLDDIVPLLFPHTMYKSYPATLLERGRFDALTRWLDGLTARDLQGIDVSGADSIDTWLDALDAQSDLRVAHSSGTTGSMSFLPRTAAEWRRQIEQVRLSLFHMPDHGGQQDGRDEFFDVIWPTYRSGRSAILRSAEEHMRLIADSEDRFHALYPGRMSSDLMFLAARLRAAEARGELAHLEASESLFARRAEFEALERDMQASIPRFLTSMVKELYGRQVYCLGTWNVLYNLARAGADAGQRGVFSPSSIVMTGGGAKGQAVPSDWKAVVADFMGVPRLQHGYGMSELMPVNYMCAHERYHVHPALVLYVLEPDTGVPKPRAGVQTGRAAFFDLMADSYWGGVVTGDEITVDWSPCACGLATAHIDPTIERYSERRGGDDKITCAAAEEAHDDALVFLNHRAAEQGI